jgi:hypothetical protein
MRIQQIVVVSLFALLFFPAANASNCESLKTFEWLLGDWVSTSSSSTITESWQRVSSQTFEGTGVTKQTDTSEVTGSETLRLVEMSRQVFYIAKVGHNKLPVPFALVSCSDKTIVFENLKHDFPKRFLYQSLADNKMSVTVTDENNKGFSLKFSK